MNKIFLFALIVFLFLGCHKVSTFEDDINMLTLNEFLSTLPNGSELAKTLPVVDNRSFEFGKNTAGSKVRRDAGAFAYITPESLEEDEGADRIRVKFKWPGMGPKGETCVLGKGICFSTTLGNVSPDNHIIGYSEEGVNSSFVIIHDKLIVEAKSEGMLTADDYLVVPDLMPLSNNVLIKPGIYKGKEKKVIVNLILL